MNKMETLVIALATQLIFILGEVPAADHLNKWGLDSSFFHPWFLLFSITRIIGMAGQLYLWSNAQLGLIAALMGSCGLLLHSLLGTLVLHQPPLSFQGYVGVSLAAVSIILLAVK